jgi:hypothetical protein
MHAPDTNNPDCVCTAPGDCVQLPEDSECRTRTCEDGVCGLAFTPDDTALAETQQTAEDCRLVVCDGAGESASIVDATDVPMDGLECTLDTCVDGEPANVPAERGTPCAAGECNANGECAGCSTPADCGGESTFCEMITCEGGVCGVESTSAGTALPEQNDGDCARLECDGRGNEASVPDDLDEPPDDGNDCSADSCEDGVIVHPALPADTECISDGGTVCDGEGSCVECTSNGQCGGGDTCMIPACVDNACTLVPNDGASCNDGLFCTEDDSCNGSGTCVGSGDPCPGADGDSDCSEGCNETADACTGLDDVGSACNDNQFCTATDTCNASGSCVGSGDPCPGPDGDADCSEECNEAADNCSSNDANNSDCGSCRTCSSGVCNFLCSPLAMCCAGDDICISMGQECP